MLLFLGPTGVGKTELAKALAEFLFGDDKKMIRIDMSEFQDGTAGIDKLIGSARGIVGSERGGVLTNQLRDHPYSVVLLDEVEKASLVAAEPVSAGVRRRLDHRRTRPPGVPERRRGDHDVEPRRRTLPPDRESVRVPQRRRSARTTSEATVMRELERRFTPEFRNRIDDVIVFAPLTASGSRHALRSIHLDRIVATAAARGKTIEITPEAIDVLVREGYSMAYGARSLKRVIDERVKVPLSQAWSSADHFRVTVASVTRSSGRASWRDPGAAPAESRLRSRTSIDSRERPVAA